MANNSYINRSPLSWKLSRLSAAFQERGDSCAQFLNAHTFGTPTCTPHWF